MDIPQKPKASFPSAQINAGKSGLKFLSMPRGMHEELKHNKKNDIDGNGGVFDFTKLILQRELSTAVKCAINTSTYLGYGRRTKALDTSIDDRNKHRGQVIRFGVNMDNARSNRDIRLQASLNGR